MKKTFFALFLTLTLLSGGCKKTPQKPRTVYIAIQPSAAFIPLYAARYKNLIEDALAPSNVTVEWQDFESGPSIRDSLAAEMSDIGVLGDVPTVTALGGNVPMTLVGIPASGANAYAMMARKDDNTFNTSADMKGKKIATVFGSTGHNFATKLLQKNGLGFDDIELISISTNDIDNSLISGVCDAVVIWEPHVTRLSDSGMTKIVAWGNDVDLRGTNGFIVRSNYLEENTDIIHTILDQYNRAVRLLPSLDEETLSKIAGALDIKPEQVLKIAKKYDFTVLITNKDIAALQDTVDFLVQIGNLSVPFSVSAKMEKVFSKYQFSHQSMKSTK